MAQPYRGNIQKTLARSLKLIADNLQAAKRKVIVYKINNKHKIGSFNVDHALLERIIKERKLNDSQEAVTNKKHSN